MRDGRLAGRTAVVTGAGSGIGREIAVAFAREGARAVCVDVDLPSAEETCRRIREAGGAALPVLADVSVSAEARAAIEAAVAAFGGVHVLVNAAAVFSPDATFADLEEAQFDRAMAVNVGGCFRMSRFAIPEMRKAGGGSIVHIASQMGHAARAMQAAYCTTKGALHSMARAMALDHAAEGIRVNSLSPGGIATQGMADKWGGMEAAEREWGARMHPVGRLGRESEVAAAALFLASDEASFVTGTDLLVDGGYTAQ